MEYLAKLSTKVPFTFMYTIEKKTALKRALVSHDTLLSVSLSNLQEVSQYLTDNLPANKLEIKAGLNSVISNIKYEQELVRQFRDTYLKD